MTLFQNFNESQIAPIGPPKDGGSSGSRMIKPIGSELSRPTTNQFPDHPSDDSDTYDYENLNKLRGNYRSLFVKKNIVLDFPDFNTSTDNIWPEKTNQKDLKFEEPSVAAAAEEKPVPKKEETATHKISVSKQSGVFMRALEDTRADADRLDATVRIFKEDVGHFIVLS